MFYVFSWFSKKSYRLVKHQVVKFHHIFPTFFIDEAASCLTWESNTEIYSKQSSTFQSQKQLNHLLPFVSQGVREDDAIFSKTAYPLTFFNLFFCNFRHFRPCWFFNSLPLTLQYRRSPVCKIFIFIIIGHLSDKMWHHIIDKVDLKTRESNRV